MRTLGWLAALGLLAWLELGMARDLFTAMVARTHIVIGRLE